MESTFTSSNVFIVNSSRENCDIEYFRFILIYYACHLQKVVYTCFKKILIQYYEIINNIVPSKILHKWFSID